MASDGAVVATPAMRPWWWRIAKWILGISVIMAATFAAYVFWLRPATLRNDGVASACQQSEFETYRFTVCAFDPAKHHLRMMVDGADGTKLRNFSNLATALGRDKKRLSFAMNAGMYGWDSAPIGLYIENGKQRRAINTRDAGGNFYNKPNGIFWKDATGYHISATDDYIALAPQNVEYASQSGPMLVINGKLHPEFVHNGPSRKTRNGVGLPHADRVLPNGLKDRRVFFVISDDPVSFGVFARFFRDVLKTPNALYFDGTVSALWDAGTGNLTQPYPLGPFVVVMDKARKAN